MPADKKWYRDLAVGEALVKTLSEYRPRWRAALRAMSETRLAELKAMRAEQHDND